MPFLTKTMNIIALFLLALAVSVECGMECPEGVPIKVSSMDALRGAIQSATPLTPIEIQPGWYEGKLEIQGKFGTSPMCPIKIYGFGEKTIFNGEKTYPCIQIKNSGFIEFSRVGMRSCDVGISVESSMGIVMDSLVIYDVHKMGIEIRKMSQKCQVGRSRIFNTGTTYSQWGYGVAIGKETVESDDYTGEDKQDSGVDACTGNTVIGNRFGPRVSAAGVVVFEGSSGGVISANTFDQSDHWVMLRGNGVTVKENIATPRMDSVEHTAKAITIGYTSSGFGSGNTVQNNKLFVNTKSDYGIEVDDRLGKGSNQVCSNSVTGANKGISNIC